MAKLAQAEATATDETQLLQLRNETFEAEMEAEKAARRFAKADAKVRNASHEAEEIGAKAPDQKDDEASDKPKLP